MTRGPLGRVGREVVDDGRQRVVHRAPKMKRAAKLQVANG